MAISFVGSKAAASTTAGATVAVSLTDLLDTSGAAATLLQNDLVVISHGMALTTNNVYSAPTGFTQDQDLYANATTHDPNMAVWYKFMGATPDTTVTLPAPGNGNLGYGYVIHAFRGVDTATPLDVTSTTASATGSANPNGASITPVTAGSWIYVAGVGAHGGGATSFSAPGDLSATTNHFKTASVNATTSDITIGAGIKTDWTSGAFDPAIWTGVAAAAGGGWLATSLVLRPASGGGSVSMAASAGSFALTGQAAALKAGRNLAAAAGSFALTGQAATLRLTRKIAASAGAFTLTGQTALLTKGFRLSASAASFALTGQTAAFRLTRRLTAVAGSFALTGQTAVLAKGFKMAAAAGSFALSGQAASLLYKRIMPVAAGVFTLTGQTALLRKGKTLAGAVGAFVLTGQTANLRLSRKIAATAGSFALTGAAATLKKGRAMPASAGRFAFYGSAVRLRLVRTVLFADITPATVAIGQGVAVAAPQAFVKATAPPAVELE